MMGTKEADLVTAVLLYAMRCLAEGDHPALRAMRFGPKEIEVLRELNLADLYYIDALQAHCLDIALDRELFWPVLANLRATRKNEELQHDLIQADAPYEMMRAFFGMGTREYTRLRRAFGAGSTGRPPDPDEETGHRLWRVITARLAVTADSELEPQDYLTVQRESGASMRAVWSLAQRICEQKDASIEESSSAKNVSSTPVRLAERTTGDRSV